MKTIGIPSPKLEEIRKAAERLGLSFEIVAEAKYPCVPWQKTGLLIVPKTAPKTQIIKNVATELCRIRMQSKN